MEKPSLPKGTRDFGPQQMARRQFILDTIRAVFQKYGFQPLETPAMENLSTLTGKYGEEGDQLLFKILNSGDYLKDAGDEALRQRNSKQLTPVISEKGLRYDLTVPFARYVVMNRHEITFPFKRYQIQPVWRADRPQKGRYREFFQCDADVVGTDSLIGEAEIILMIQEVFAALGINDYSIKMNHRGVLSGLAEIAGISEHESSLFVALDKLDKIGESKVREELAARGFSDKSIQQVFEVLAFDGTNQAKLDFLNNQYSNSDRGRKGVSDLAQVLEYVTETGSNHDQVSIDASLARGLTYYTGTIFEVKINNVAVGSVSGGGRYDNLTGVFGMPGVSGTGFSFGVDRLYDAMEELRLFPKDTGTSSKVLIAHMDDKCLRSGLGLLRAIRSSGIASEIYPEEAKLKKQLEYANKKMIPFVIVIGPDELASGRFGLKNMQSGDQQALSLEQIISAVKTG